MVVGGAGSGGSGSGVTPFIEIPTSRDELQSINGSGGANTNSSSSGRVGAGDTLQSVLNNTLKWDLT
jgi:hypothetical protein